MQPDLRNLPAPVLERLAAADLDLRQLNLDVVQRGQQLEARAFARGELRADDDGNPVLDGYATVYDVAYDVAGGPPYGWEETVVAGACIKSVRERADVRLLINHDGIVLGRTRSKTLELESDDTGLRCHSVLDGASPIVAGLSSAMARGDMDEMSFAFRVIRQEWNSDYTERFILEVKLYDVSVVSFPANPATVAQLRADPDASTADVRTEGMSLTLALANAEQLRRRHS